MQYSLFGKVPVLCKACNRLTNGIVGEGVGPHWLAVVCDKCGKHTSQWIAQRTEREPENPLVDEAKPVKWRRPQPSVQPPTLFEGM